MLLLPLNHITIEQNWKFICVSLPKRLSCWWGRRGRKCRQSRHLPHGKWKCFRFHLHTFRTAAFNWRRLVKVCGSIWAHQSNCVQHEDYTTHTHLMCYHIHRCPQLHHTLWDEEVALLESSAHRETCWVCDKGLPGRG